MITILLAVLYVIGFIIYFTKRNYILFYYIAWSVFAPYMASFLTFDYDVSLFIDGQSNYFLALIFIINILIYKGVHIPQKITRQILVIVLLLMVASLWNSVPYGFYISWFISNILPLYFVISILNTVDINSKHFGVFLLIMILIQVVVGTCQYYIGLFVNPAYALNNIGSLYDNIFQGTFRGENNCMAFLCMCFLVLLINNREGKSINKFGTLILFAIVSFAVLISGVRTYLMLLIFFVAIILYISSSKKLMTLSYLIGFAFLLSTYLIVDDYTSGRSGDTDAISRQINGISAVANNDTENSTLDYTFYMLNTHFNPISPFGQGKLHTKKGYDRITMSTGTEASVSDATLAVFLVEFGPILLFLFLYYYFSCTCKQYYISNSNYYRYSVLLYGFYFIASVTDAGIFDILILTMLSIFSKIQNRKLS